MKKTSKASHKLFRAALATTVATGAFVAAVPAETNAAISFKDVTNPAVHYYKPVLELAERGVVKGYDDGTYRPNASVTRAQSAKILAHVLDLDTVNVKDPGFKDVKKGTPYYGPIAALANAGYIKGYEDKGVKTFKPNNNLTRSQMAKILTLGFDLKEESLAADRFKDVKPSDAYAGYVAALVALNITTGTTPTTFSPNGLVTRGQMATFVVRTETALKVEKPEVPEQPENPDPTPPTTPEEPDNPTPIPPTVEVGNQMLHSKIVDILAQGNNSTDAVAVSLSGNTFTVDIKKPTTTVNDFKLVAKPIFNAFKTNTIINSVTVSLVIDNQSVVISQSNIDLNQDFETVVDKALAKVGASGTTNLSALQGKTVTMNVVGTIDGTPFNSTYSFVFGI
ncbi:hypothetical protein SporoP8_12130 [Sporosarcina ureae]|uniref:S-layer homology domain-containing protein n=1 Tax=Sporosarcina TaxID=1569 RepID=UPI000A1619B2|nr:MULTISPECIES: S-layer homology domain-containing protein [Sporosarcina]ARJ39557.1 hypothetical protein SporoP8_12130 [Sporosarcina ureae]PIC83068.1 S-layer homology domain-containing protein [Sporosarcina sp. P1]